MERRFTIYSIYKNYKEKIIN